MLISIWRRRNSHSLLLDMQNGAATLEDSWFLTKQHILLPFNPEITLIGIYPKELKTYVHTKTCTWMFIAALSIIAKTWKSPRCPSRGEWINKLVYPDNGILSSAKKKEGNPDTGYNIDEP